MEPQNWHRGPYQVSTDPGMLQIEAVNAALGSDIVWWAKKLPAAELREALRNSLCFGLYKVSDTNAKSPIEAPNGIKPSSSPVPRSFEQVGLVRVITDGVTFAYLTDVYILEEHQGKGHGRWMLECLNEVLQSWPHLRRVMLLTSDRMELFRKNLGMKDWREIDTKTYSIAMLEGPGYPSH